MFNNNQPMKELLIFSLLCLAALPTLGQRKLLMLEKADSRKNAYYEVGDELTFYAEGRKSRISDRIRGFTDSTIVFRHYEVLISRITALHIDDQTRWWLRFKPAQLLLIAGAGYLLIDIASSLFWICYPKASSRRMFYPIVSHAYWSFRGNLVTYEDEKYLFPRKLRRSECDKFPAGGHAGFDKII